MKKLTLLVYHKDYNEFLKDIRELGVIHVVEKQQGAAENEELQENLRLSGQLNSILSQFKALNKQNNDYVQPEMVSGSPERGLEILEEVENLQNEKNKLIQLIQNTIKDENALEPWGNFNPESISRLHDSGMDVNFFICPEREYNPEWEDQYNAIVINKSASKIYFITVTKKGDDIDIDTENIRLPHGSLSQLRTKREELEKEEKNIDERLSQLAANEQFSVEAAIDNLHRRIEYSKVILNTELTAGEKLMLLQGWVPETEEPNVRSYLNDRNTYFEISDPVPGDDIPILLKNKGIFSWFEPIVKLYMLPQYSELDLTPFFAPFFMVFFGLCLGDMGYGLFLLLLVTGYRMFAKNIGPKIKPVLSLVQVLSISTIVCGLLTGGFFGYNLYDLDWPIAQRLKSAVMLDNNQMFQLSLILGVIQILFGMILKVINQTIQFGFKYAVSTLGWVTLLLSIIFAVLVPSVLPLFGTVHVIIVGISVLMIFLFNSPGKNVLVNIGLGFWDTYNMATGLLGDVLSYVRLFALGLSGGILASVFNNLAAGLSPDNIIAGPIVFLLIFLIGHAINIFMNVLGALVHPMRLTFVEFFKNSGYEGGGQEYRPFSK